MRSEERSGIIAIALILLWGTLITEPFRYFAEIISNGIDKVSDAAGIMHGGKIESIVISVAIGIIAIILLKLSSLKAGHVIGPFMSCIALAVFLINCLRYDDINKGKFAALVIAVVLIFVLAIIRAEKILIWITDAFILALPVYLLVSWVFVPISLISDKVHKYMFICRRSFTNLANAFADFLTVPAIVWGIFFFILTALPVIYFIPGRRKG